MTDHTTHLTRLLLHVDGSRPGRSQKPLTPAETDLLLQHPSLVEMRGERWTLTSEGRKWAREHDPRPDTNPVANRLYVKLYKIAGLDNASAVDAARRGGLDASSSRVYGWRKHPSDRKHTAMTMEELESVMNGILHMDAAEAERQRDLAGKIMDEDRDILQALAKGTPR